MDPTLTDPFQEPAQTPANAPNLTGEWSQALGDPKVQTALLQFGISMLQPPSFGDTTGSQFGRAVGHAGEALTAQDEIKRKQQATDSQQTLREAQATAAEARAAGTGARNDAAAARLDLAREKLGLSQILAANRNRTNIMNAYTRARAKYEEGRILDQKLPPFPDLNTWAAQTGVADMLSQEGMTPQGGAGSGIDPATRVVGQVYNTPKGPLKWTGSGWLPP